MTVAMREELLGKMCQVFRDVRKMGDANGEHDAPSLDFFARIQPQLKSVRRSFGVDNKFAFQFRHHPFSEGQPITAKGSETHGNAQSGVLDPALRTEMP